MKIKKFSENSVYAVVKYLYGGRLTEKNYRDLINLGSVRAVAEYLKSKTSYSAIFDGVNTSGELSRSRLENMLDNKMYDELEKTARFQKAAGSRLYEFFITKFDAVQIMNALAGIESGGNDYFFNFPVFYNERSRLDLYKLAKAKTREDLLKTIEGTIYEPVLNKCVKEYNLTKNLAAVQAEFRNFSDGEFLKLLGRGKTENLKKRELVKLYGAMKDVHIVKVLYRMTRFEDMDETAKLIQNPKITYFSKKELKSLCEKRTPEELDEALLGTYLSPIVKNSKKYGIFRSADEYIYKILTDAAGRSSDPDTVMFAYFNYSEIEIKNIIHIIEAIRYGLSPAEISPFITGFSGAAS